VCSSSRPRHPHHSPRKTRTRPARGAFLRTATCLRGAACCGRRQEEGELLARNRSPTNPLPSVQGEYVSRDFGVVTYEWVGFGVRFVSESQRSKAMNTAQQAEQADPSKRSSQLKLYAQGKGQSCFCICINTYPTRLHTRSHTQVSQAQRPLPCSTAKSRAHTPPHHVFRGATTVSQPGNDVTARLKRYSSSQTHQPC
jgi:hypothetical protein